MQRTITGMGWLLGGGLIAATVFAAMELRQQDQPSKQDPAVAETQVNEASTEIGVTLGSLTVAVDESGNLRPLSRNEARQLAREMREMFKPRDLSTPTVRPDGSLSAIAAPNVLRFSTARIAENGDVVLDCVAGTETTLESLITERSATDLATVRGEM